MLLVLFTGISQLSSQVSTSRQFDRLLKKYNADTLHMGSHVVEQIRHQEVFHCGLDGQIRPRFEFHTWRIDGHAVLESSILVSTDPRSRIMELSETSSEIVLLSDSSLAFWCQNYESPFSYASNGGCSTEQLLLIRCSITTTTKKIRFDTLWSCHSSDCPDCYLKVHGVDIYYDNESTHEAEYDLFGKRPDGLIVESTAHDTILCTFYNLIPHFRHSGEISHADRRILNRALRFVLRYDSKRALRFKRVSDMRLNPKTEPMPLRPKALDLRSQLHK